MVRCNISYIVILLSVGDVLMMVITGIMTIRLGLAGMSHPPKPFAPKPNNPYPQPLTASSKIPFA